MASHADRYVFFYCLTDALLSTEVWYVIWHIYMYYWWTRLVLNVTQHIKLGFCNRVHYPGVWPPLVFLEGLPPKVHCGWRVFRNLQEPSGTPAGAIINIVKVRMKVSFIDTTSQTHAICNEARGSTVLNTVLNTGKSGVLQYPCWLYHINQNNAQWVQSVSSDVKTHSTVPRIWRLSE